MRVPTKNHPIDWRSLYFIELFWIAQTYSWFALMVTYIVYLVTDMRLNKNASVPESIPVPIAPATKFE